MQVSDLGYGSQIVLLIQALDSVLSKVSTWLKYNNWFSQVLIHLIKDYAFCMHRRFVLF